MVTLDHFEKEVALLASKERQANISKDVIFVKDQISAIFRRLDSLKKEIAK